MGSVVNQNTTWLDSYSPSATAASAGTLAGTAGAAKAYANTGSTSSPSLNVYGSGNDLSSAMKTYSGKQGVNFIDTSASGFDPSSMTSGIMLGGNAVNTNVSDSMLKNAGVQRVWGQTGADTANALNNYMSSYGKPTTPTVSPLTITATAPSAMQTIATPEYKQFQFTQSLQDYLDQAQGVLKPQLDLATSNINDNYNTSYIPQANNDSLKRGLARSSFAGNRVDTLNASRQKDITNATLQNMQQANTLGMQNYNLAYDRAYQLNSDENNYNWQKYGADVSNAQNQYNNAWNKYRADVEDQTNLYNTNTNNAWKSYDAQNQDYWNTKNYDQQQAEWNWNQIKDKNAESWKKIQYEYGKERDAVSDKQYQEQFDYKKSQDAISNALAAQKASSSGGSKKSSSGSSGSSGSYTKTQISDMTKVKFDDMLSQVSNGTLAEEDANKWLQDNKNSIVENAGLSTYNSMASKLKGSTKAVDGIYNYDESIQAPTESGTVLVNGDDSEDSSSDSTSGGWWSGLWNGALNLFN